MDYNEVEKKQEKRNLEQSNAQSKEIDNNTLLHHSKQALVDECVCVLCVRIVCAVCVLSVVCVCVSTWLYM